MATQWTAGTTSGQVLTASTLNTIGAVTVDYTPTLTQGVTVTKTVVQARYFQFQKFVTGQILMNCTSAGTAGSVVAVGLPISARATNSMTAFGYIYDANTNVMYNVTGYSATGTTLNFFYQTGNAFGVSPAVTLANTDQISLNFSYEIA
jgi:hypothetical protein